MINLLILKHSISLVINIVIYHPDINFTDSYFSPKYLNVYSHDLGGSTSLAVVISVITVIYITLKLYEYSKALYNIKCYAYF